MKIIKKYAINDRTWKAVMSGRRYRGKISGKAINFSVKDGVVFLDDNEVKKKVSAKMIMKI